MSGSKPSLSEISLPFQVIVLFVLGLVSSVMAVFSVIGIGFTDQGVMKPFDQIDPIILVFPLMSLFCFANAIYLCFMRMTINSKGISYRVSKKRHGAISWEDAKTVGILRLTGGERLIIVSILTEHEAISTTNPLRNRNPLNTTMKIPYTKKRFECIQAYWPKEIAEFLQKY